MSILVPASCKKLKQCAGECGLLDEEVVSLWVLAMLVSFGSQVKQEDPLNLSILLSGGRETNKDSPSKGD